MSKNVKVKFPETQKEALDILVKAVILAQKQGIFELGDAALIYQAILFLEQNIEQKTPSPPKSET